MKRLVTAIILAILLVGLVLLGISDTDIAIADTSIPDNKTTASQTKTNNSSAIAMIMGSAWTTPSGEGGSNEL